MWWLIGWFIISSLANWATFPADPAEWERIKTEEPRRAALLQLLRGFGVYPNKIISGLYTLITGKK